MLYRLPGHCQNWSCAGWEMRQEKAALRFCWQQSVVLSPLKYYNKNYCRVLRKAGTGKMTRRSVNALSQLLSIRKIFFKANTALLSSTPVKTLFKSHPHHFSDQRVQRRLQWLPQSYSHFLLCTSLPRKLLGCRLLKLMLSDLFCRRYESMCMQQFVEQVWQFPFSI